MTLERVDFYLLKQSVPDGKLRTACRLARKVYDQGYTAYIHTPDRGQAGRLDELMWTFEQGSFVPHHLDGGDDPAPVTIGCESPQAGRADVLISLAADAPEDIEAWYRIAELVDGTDEERQLARKRYKVYRDRGCRLETHHIDP